MGMFSKEKKGMNCIPNPDGSQTCRRILKNNKTGELLTTGEEVTISADPSNNCTPTFSGGNLTVLDDEWGKFEEVAGKVSAGCRKANQPQQNQEVVQ